MAKVKLVYSCTSCGRESNRWEGRCPSCESWGSLVEVEKKEQTNILLDRNKPSEMFDYPTLGLSESMPERFLLGMEETERVLGGGLVAGSVTLLVGEPGIGKSTLLLQIADGIGKNTVDETVYVTGEESPSQLAIRGKRLGIKGDKLKILPETNLDTIITELDQRGRQSLVLIDSIQTLFDPDSESLPGTVSQIRSCASRLATWAKSTMTPLIMTGHVTKDGNVGGPKILEHIVDVVLQLDGNGVGPFRTLFGFKNRFGSTNEIAVFHMLENGMVEVNDPSSDLISERPKGVPGSVVVPIIEGTRPILVEIQALVSSTSNISDARRIATGVDVNRLILISNVLSKRASISMARNDVMVNVVGGIKISETAADLGIALAIVSSALDKNFPADMAAIGELGLTGEVRRTTQMERRILELSRLGFKKVIIPESAYNDLLMTDTTLKLLPINNINDAIRYL